MKSRHTIAIVIITLGIIFSATAATAHDAWIEARDYSMAPGEELTLVMAYDHYFPTRIFMTGEDLDEIYLLQPDGGRMALNGYSDVEYKSDQTLSQKGAHLVAATQKGTFWTKTTKGYQKGKSKKGLKNAIACTYSAKFAKAVVNVGDGGSDLISKPLGHDLEIIPLANPAALRSGDNLPVQVLYKGNPLGGAQVLATYAGFSQEKNTFCYATKTDAEGKAVIRVDTRGIWLVTAHNKVAYPDSDECDQNSFAASLTVEIQ